MTPARARPRSRLAALAAVLSLAAPASAQLLRERDEIPELQGVDLVELVGERLPLDVALTDSSGRPVTLADYFVDDKPAILALVYYDCPVVCPVVMDRLAQSLNGLDYVVGRDFRVIVASFDPSETYHQAFERKQVDLSGYTHGSTPETNAGWTFHVADAVNAKRLCDAVGFDVQRLNNGEYSHPVGLTILSPDGMVSSYMYGFDYPPRQLKLALLDASEGRIARSIGDRIMHFCYRFDPNAGKYSVQAMAVMRLGAGATVLLLVVFIGGLFVSERVRRVRRATAPLAARPTLGLGSTP